MRSSRRSSFPIVLIGRPEGRYTKMLFIVVKLLVSDVILLFPISLPFLTVTSLETAGGQWFILSLFHL